MNNNEATRKARSSLKISGFEFDQESELLDRLLANGEITTEEARKRLFAKVEQWKIERPEFFTEPDV